MCGYDQGGLDNIQQFQAQLLQDQKQPQINLILGQKRILQLLIYPRNPRLAIEGQFQTRQLTKPCLIEPRTEVIVDEISFKAEKQMEKDFGLQSNKQSHFQYPLLNGRNRYCSAKIHEIQVYEQSSRKYRNAFLLKLFTTAVLLDNETNSASNSRDVRRSSSIIHGRLLDDGTEQRIAEDGYYRDN
ncbi:MAG: hypothetical protein EZS28_045484 [Streblomastix strix]|uniref:Uncharacterized protein n=1 Tax=Streblomastix strix TaxID=222440 RepID=A0A5J4TLZ3_9EUKA|nr:MAG: hypothetical protein EZS28_045484 [Streblomastix strix]